ncbi:MAG TPA: PAS domain S-box protein [Candidatus Angelobacter sp.]|nr:PAS domain S-box protein [Candidatus Angelobacter sp.]
MEIETGPPSAAGRVEVAATGQDADELLKLQSDALEASANAIVITDATGTIQWVNRAFVELTGYSRGEAIGKNPRFLKSDSHDHGFYRRMWQTIRAGKVWRGELVNRRKDGTLYTEEQTITPLRGDSGEIRHYIGVKQDVSRRKEMENALQRQQQYFHTLIEKAADIITVVGPDGAIRYESPSLKRVLGWEPEDLIGRSVFDLAHPDDRENVARALARISSAPGAIESVKFRYRHKDGSWRVLESVGRNLTNDPGVGGVVVNSRDVTERTRVEEALRESESLYQATFNEAPIGIAQTGLEGRFVKANRRFCEMLGYAPEELLQWNFRDVTFSEDIGRDLESIRKLLAGEIQHDRIEKRYVRKDGKIVWVSRTASLRRDASGTPEHFLVVVEDITERRQAEEGLAAEKQFFDTAIDALPGIFYLFDREGRLLRWNRNLERVTGYSPAEIAAMHPREFFADEERHLIEQKIGEVLQNGEVTVEAGLVCKDGRRLPYFFTGARTLRDRTPCVIGMGVDLSERKKLEAQFLRAQRLESIGTLASGIAHDLNNILAPILMAEQLLSLKEQDAESRGFLAMIAGSAQRGAEVVKQVLTFARGVEGERVLVQPRHLVREVEKIARETFPRAISVKTNLAPDLWPVTGDATQLHQVLLNLCVNARDAMPDGGTLSLAGSNLNLGDDHLFPGPGVKAGAFVVLEVEDTGTGIPANIVDKIFDPFFTTKEQGKGTGLGLSTVVGIVKSHGGFVNVASEVGKGTKFGIFLPATSGSGTKSSDGGPAALPSGRGELVLVVDDEESIRDVTRNLLSRHGYEVLVASDGTEAVALVAQLPGRISLILTDIMMPFMDGVALIRAVRKLDPRIKVVASSGLGQADKMAELKNLSVKTFLAKPYTAENLLVTLQELLHGPARPDENEPFRRTIIDESPPTSA